jgi:hypothetical protein
MRDRDKLKDDAIAHLSDQLIALGGWMEIELGRFNRKTTVGTVGIGTDLINQDDTSGGLLFMQDILFDKRIRTKTDIAIFVL